MVNHHIIIAVVLVFLLGIAPPIGFLMYGWRTRRNEIQRGLSGSAMRQYFLAFHNRDIEDPAIARDAFDRYYNEQYGRKRFVPALVLFGLVSGLLLCWSGMTAELMLRGEPLDGHLPAIAVLAVMGALLWIIFDGIHHCYLNRLSPAHVYWWTLRLVIAIPLSYATMSLLADGIAPAVAFFMGALPLAQLLTVSRRVVAEYFKKADSPGNSVSELQGLQGIDALQAERFAEESITTILQLAYCDPIKLTIRTGLNYSHISDCICQALLWIYVEGDKVKLRTFGLRSAYEVHTIWRRAQSLDVNTAKEANSLVSLAAAAIGYPEDAFKHVLYQVARDQYTVFLFESWTGNSKPEGNPEKSK